MLLTILLNAFFPNLILQIYYNQLYIFYKNIHLLNAITKFTTKNSWLSTDILKLKS